MDIPALQRFAVDQGMDLTAPLSNDQVRILADYWVPDVFLHEDERFHPIDIRAMTSQVENVFGAMTPQAREEWRLTYWVRTGVGPPEQRRFDPPVVAVKDGEVLIPTGNGGMNLLTVFDVLTQDAPPSLALGGEGVGPGAHTSHGASSSSANHFFGASNTRSGGTVGKPGDPLVPRVAGPDGSTLVVHAAWKDLMSTLRFDLLADQARDDIGPNVLVEGFDIVAMLFRPTTTDAWPFPRALKQEITLLLIEEHLSGTSSENTEGLIPPGWILDEKTWWALRQYAFLEYDFYYAYNDFDRVQTTPFENEHEGDNEGCCLVFDKAAVYAALDGGSDDDLRRVVPESIITSVHEENQNADRFAHLSPPVLAPGELPRDKMTLQVYVALGSHATYLTPGDHELVDTGDVFATIADRAAWLWLVPAVPPAIALIVAMLDHFIDTHDETSEDGLHGIPPGAPSDPESDHLHVELVPLSAGENVYQESSADRLRYAAFPGAWGGHRGSVDTSPRYVPKTGRYFRQLLSH